MAFLATDMHMRTHYLANLEGERGDGSGGQQKKKNDINRKKNEDGMNHRESQKERVSEG